MGFEIYKDAKREFRFRLRANNHKIIAVSEGYTRKANAINGIYAVAC